MQPEEDAAQAAATPYGKLALAFVQALAAGNFDAAHRMLTPATQLQFTPSTLALEYGGMASYVEGTKVADRIEITTANSMEGWASQEPGDLGWAYVSVIGPDPEGGVWVEAVSVIVTTQLLIREISWGRP